MNRLAILGTVAALSLLVLTGCVSAEQQAADDAAEQAETEQMLWEASGHDGPRPSNADAIMKGIPAGYNDLGNGLAYKWKNTDIDCEYYDGCIVAMVYAYGDCPSSVYLEANILDENDTVINYTNGTLSALSAGQKGEILLGDINGNGAKFQMTDSSCY